MGFRGAGHAMGNLLYMVLCFVETTKRRLVRPGPTGESTVAYAACNSFLGHREALYPGVVLNCNVLLQAGH